MPQNEGEVLSDLVELENAPHASTSYKLAGGGLLSTVGDLLRVGHVLLYSFQVDALRAQLAGAASCGNSGSQSESAIKLPDGYISGRTLGELWTPVTGKVGLETRAERRERSAEERRTRPLKGYGLGWSVRELGAPAFGCAPWPAPASAPAPHSDSFSSSAGDAPVPLFAYHTGGAVGASSVLFIVPFDTHSDLHNWTRRPAPQLQ